MASQSAENIAFLRECYGPISFRCSVVGCPHYDVGFEQLQERDSHVASHNRRFKCPERGCFYEEVGFANSRSLNRHFSQCHTDMASHKFFYPRPSNSRLPTVDEQKRFRDAIESGDIGPVREMIHINSSLTDRVGLDDHTGLQHAARHGNMGSALLLLHSGSNIGAVNIYGTALNVACSWGQTDMIQFLLSNSSCEEDVNARDRWGDTPLLSILGSRYASHPASVQLAVVPLLLKDSRVFADSKNRDGRTPLSLAAAIKRPEAALLAHMLLEHGGIDVNTRDRFGRTPLSWAVCAFGGDSGAAVVKVLLGHDEINVGARDKWGRTPLSWAASEGTAVVVNALLEHGVGVDVNAKDNEGRTPLSLAAARWQPGAAPVVKMLLEYDRVDVDAKDNEGRTPLSWAAARKYSESETELVVKILLERDEISQDERDNGGRTPLSWAASQGNVGAVNAFLEHGVGIDVNAKDNEGRTPLSWAAARENDLQRVPVVKALMEHGGVGGAL